MQPNNQYDFITNHETPQAPGGIKSVGKMSKLKLALIGGGVLILLLIVITVVVSMTSKQPENGMQLSKVVAQQAELIKISEIAIKEAKNIETKNMAMTTKLSLKTDQATLAAALKAQKLKIPKYTKGNKNEQTLNNAAQNNQFDKAYMELIQIQLTEYQKNVNSAYKSTVNKKLKATLENQFKNASTLAKVDPEIK